MNVYNTTSGYKLIYIFAINDDKHKGLLKIGDATINTSMTLDELMIPNNDALMQAAYNNRIKHYTYTAGIRVDILWAQLALIKSEQIFNGSAITVFQGFRDYDVHNVLKNSGISCSYPDGIKCKEWFACNLQTAKNAINAVKEGRSFLSESDKVQAVQEPVIKFRDEQNAAVEKTQSVYKTKDKMLWNCKMRFGKTLTAYELIRSSKYQKTIVVTHRPVVEHSWEDDHRKLFGADSSHIFMKKQNLSFNDDYFDQASDLRNDIALNNAKRNGDYFTYFASMQDLRGSKRAGGKFNKNNAVFDMDWDLIIYDEAHEGTQTDLGQTVQNLLESSKNGKTPKVLELSGTPYNIMDKYEDNVYSWDYVKEQRAKEEWDYKHPGERNPYADLPKMNIFTFDMSKALPTSYRFETETSAFNFREFFRTWTGEAEKDFRPIPQGKRIGNFVHEEDVEAFLNIITTESQDTKYPFATDEFRKEFKHTFWIVPGVKEASAFSALLKRHPVFSHYFIVNVAGAGDMELPYDDAYKAVTDAIKEHEYTITLSCGKLTTGVTIKEWSAVMMLTGSSTTDAKGYMQTIFRVQSAGQIDGKQKENCYVFDFAPDRALKVITEAHQLSKKGKNSDAQYKAELGQFLNYCPVHAIDGVRMLDYDVNSLMRQIKHISVDTAIKTGFEDDTIYKVDAGLVMDDSDREFFAMLKNRLEPKKKEKNKTEVTLADNGMTNEEYEKAKKAERKPKQELTPAEQAALDKLNTAKKEQKKFLALLRNISIRLPLLIYGADVDINESINMKKFIEIVDDESWEEFLPKDITKDMFRRSIKYFDEDVLIGAGLRIRRLVKQADEYPPTERIRRITEIIGHFRNPDKETVLTPWRVVNMHLSDTIGGYCFLNEKFENDKPLDEPRYVSQGQVTQDLFENPDSKILEINSKSGLYPLYAAYSIYRNSLPKREEDLSLEEQNAIWNKVIKENIFVLCKTTMAAKITIRTLAGFSGAKVNTHYQPHLLEQMQKDMPWVVKKITNPETWKLKGEKMNFNAVIGNPPYQEQTGGSKSQATPLYNYFVVLSKNLYPNYFSLIMPDRWFAGGFGLNTFRSDMLNDDRLQKIKIFPLAQECFPGVDIPGGICYYIWNKNHHGNCNVIVKSGDKLSEMDRPLLENDNDVFIKYNEGISIIRKVQSNGFISIENNISPQRPFGLPTTYIGKNHNFENALKVYGRNQTISYASPQDITSCNDLVDKWKVFISASYGERITDNFFVVGKPFIGKPFTVCSETYIVFFNLHNERECNNLISYIKSQFFRFMVLLRKPTQHTLRKVYGFVPMQDFTEHSDIDWSKPIAEIDAQLYKKYNLTPDEITFIETMIKPME